MKTLFILAIYIILILPKAYTPSTMLIPYLDSCNLNLPNNITEVLIKEGLSSQKALFQVQADLLKPG